MIKKIDEHTYKIRVKKTYYNIAIMECRNRDNTFSYEYTINRHDMTSFWKALSISFEAGNVARDFAKERIHLNWELSPIFKTREIAEKFLYYLDRKYNPTPEPIKEFIDIKLLGNL